MMLEYYAQPILYKKATRTAATKCSLLVSVLFALIIISLLLYNFPLTHTDRESTTKAMFNLWRSCILGHLQGFRNNSDGFFEAAATLVANCESRSLFRRLDEQSFAGKWYHIHSKTRNQNGSFVALNVNSIDAVRKIRKSLPATTLFYTAAKDAALTSQEDNRNDTTGYVFPFHVGAESGFRVEKTPAGSKIVPKVNVSYFLSKMLNLTTIDNIWFNGDPGDFQVLNYYTREGEFEANNLTICQSSIQLPHPNKEQKAFLHNFTAQLAEEGRFALFKLRTAGRITLNLIDFESPGCQHFL